jgi:hypothetical protein
VLDLDFEIRGVKAVPHSVSPLLAFDLLITAKPAEVLIHSVVLRVQIMIEATRRQYSPNDQERLLDIFGEPERWSQTLRTMLWTHASTVVPTFEGQIAVDLPVPCTFDFNVAGTKYFSGIENGEIPVAMLFSGSIFYETEEKAMQVAQISWEKEARFKMQISVWKTMMDLYYPNIAWLCLRKDAFDRLYEYKVRHGIPTWEQVMEKLIPDSQS